MMYKDEKFWDRIASRFDRIERNDISYKHFINTARRYINSNDAILDFGCGTGLICTEMAENVRIIHAIDISNQMIEIAKNKASARNIRNIKYTRTTIFDEKYEAGSFDAIIAFNIFHLLEEPKKHFQRLNHLLKPGGLIISSTPCMSEAPFLNCMLKTFSFFGITPKLNAFTSSELEQLLVNVSFSTKEMNRTKPKSPIFTCVLEKPL